MLAQLTAMYRNVHRSEKEVEQGTEWVVEDFLPDWLGDERPHVALDPMEQMEKDLMMVELMNVAFGGRDLRGQATTEE